MPAAPRVLCRHEFNTQRYACPKPRCGRWFRNKSGLTQHQNAAHPVFPPPPVFPSPSPHPRPLTPPPSFPELDGSNLEDGQPDYEAPSPSPDRVATLTRVDNEAASVDQIDHPVNARFFGPGNKLYRNYHVKLNGTSSATNTRNMPLHILLQVDLVTLPEYSFRIVSYFF